MKSRLPFSFTKIMLSIVFVLVGTMEAFSVLPANPYVETYGNETEISIHPKFFFVKLPKGDVYQIFMLFPCKYLNPLFSIELKCIKEDDIHEPEEIITVPLHFFKVRQDEFFYSQFIIQEKYLAKDYPWGIILNRSSYDTTLPGYPLPSYVDLSSYFVPENIYSVYTFQNTLIFDDDDLARFESMSGYVEKKTDIEDWINKLGVYQYFFTFRIFLSLILIFILTSYLIISDFKRRQHEDKRKIGH